MMTYPEENWSMCDVTMTADVLATSGAMGERTMDRYVCDGDKTSSEGEENKDAANQRRRVASRPVNQI